MFYILSIGFSACLRPVGARALVMLISLAGGRPNGAWATGPACSWGPCVPASPPPRKELEGFRAQQHLLLTPRLWSSGVPGRGSGHACWSQPGLPGEMPTAPRGERSAPAAQAPTGSGPQGSGSSET